MRRLSGYILCVASLLSVAGTWNAGAQMLYDSAAVRLIKQGIGYMYNQQFGEAWDICSETERLYPQHPVNSLLRGILIYNEYNPLIISSPERSSFEEELRNCISMSMEKPYSEDYEAESLLANMCARGLLLTFYSENGLSMNVIPLTTSTYKYLKRSFDFVSEFADFYFFTGLYNYYWEAYPRVHPIYKALASLFPPGDMNLGLYQLNNAAQNAVFLRAEALSILSWIYTGFENNFQQSALYSETLLKLYPENPIFKTFHIKNLLLLNDYDHAEDIITGFQEDTLSNYFKAQLLLFNAIIQEKKYKNYLYAKELYEEGITLMSSYGDVGKEYCGYGYIGLSRISEYNGDKVGKKSYRRNGNDLLVFKKVNFD